MKEEQNTLMQNPSEQISSEKKPRRKKKSFMGLFDIGNFVSYEGMVRNLPFILFLAVIGIIYIWNEHQVEKTIIETARIEKEMKKLNWEFTTSKSELEYSSKMSEVARILDQTGIQILRVPPKKIVVNNGN